MGDEEAHLLVCVFQRVTEVLKIDFDALGKPSPVARDARQSDRVRREGRTLTLSSQRHADHFSSEGPP